jgi:glycosyltransferase involved in cell wall biosynthesis
VEDAGLRCHRITERHAGDARVVPQLRRIIAGERPDIIQTHNTKSHFLLRCTGAGQASWIAFHHGFTARDWKDKAYNRLGRWALKGAPHVVTVCRAFQQDLVKSGIAASRISIRHNSVVPIVLPGPQERMALRQSLGIPADTPVVLAIGRLSSEKGHRDLLDALALLRRNHPALRFHAVIVGDGPERARLIQQADDLGVSGRLLFAGHQQDVRPYYGLADVFVLPSYSEGSPNVLLEAMSAGLPIVATAVGGTVDLVSDGDTALLVNAGAADAMSAAIERLLTDRNLASRLATRAEASSRSHTPAAYARSIIDIYEAVLHGIGGAECVFR